MPQRSEVNKANALELHYCAHTESIVLFRYKVDMDERSRSDSRAICEITAETLADAVNSLNFGQDNNLNVDPIALSQGFSLFRSSLVQQFGST
jgi:hypothetical protein